VVAWMNAWPRERIGTLEDLVDRAPCAPPPGGAWGAGHLDHFGRGKLRGGLRDVARARRPGKPAPHRGERPRVSGMAPTHPAGGLGGGGAA